MNYLAETLNELTKEKRKGYGEYPKCPECGYAMVWTFSFRYKEWACLPCYVTAPMFHGFDKVWRNIKYMDAKKRLWQRDLSVIARTEGGATCAVCNDKTCKWCKDADNKNYKFTYWKTRIN